MGPDHLFRLHSREWGGRIDDALLDAHLLRVEAMDDQFAYITTYLVIGITPNELFATQKKHLVTKSTNYQLIAGKLSKLGEDGILRRCILEHEQQELLREAHEGMAGGHYVEKPTMHKVLHARLW